MSTVFELDTKGWEDRVADARLKPREEPEAGFWDNTLGAMGSGLMRGTINAADFLNTITPDGAPAPDLYTEDSAAQFYEQQAQTAEQREMSDLAQRTFGEETRRNAVDLWTPDARTTGVAGRVAGGLAEMAIPLIAGGGNPTLLVGTQTLASGKRLVDEGVDATTAGVGAAIEGAATAAGALLPAAFGKTLAQRMLTGAAANTAMNMGATFAEQKLLEARGYEDLAKSYDPLDMEARSIDLLLGAAFGGIAHVAAVRMPPSARNAVLATANAKHFQQDTAPGRPLDAAASVAHQRAMETAMQQVLNDEPVSVPPEVMQANFEARLARMDSAEEAWRDVFGNDPPKAPERGAEIPPVKFDSEASQLLREPIEEIARLGVDENFRAGIRAVYEKAAEVKPKFDRSVREIAEEIGTSHAPLIPKTLKGPARAAEKAIADYGGDPSKVRDFVRATVIVDDVATVTKAIEAAKVRFGEPSRLRNTLDPEIDPPDGYRDVNLNFSVDGHTVELQVHVPEIIQAKDRMHKLYEERRTIDAQSRTRALTAKELARMNALDEQMRQGYAAAWNLALSRSKASSEISTPSSRGSLSETARPAGASQARTKAPPSDVGTTDTGTPSQSKNFGSLSKKAISDTSGSILSEDGTESPVMSAVKELLIQQDVMVATGELDANGNAVVRSGREVMAEAEAGIAKAKQDGKGIEAAVNCFLTRGTNAA